MKSKFILIFTIAMTALTAACTSEGKHNTLTQQEAADGWELLFDGTSLDGWRDYNGDSLLLPGLPKRE